MSPLTIQELRKKAKETSPIVLVTTIEADPATTKIEYRRENDTYAYIKLPTTDYGTCEELLYCLQEFNEAARMHGWQGQQRFTKYRMTLRGEARTTWDAAVESGPANFQEATFTLAIRTICEGLNGVGADDNLLEYLRQAKKPHSMTPSQVAVRLTVLCNYAIFFSQEDGSQGEAIPALLRRQLLVNMHPDHWIKKFRDANLSAATSSIPEIVQYMSRQQALEAGTSNNRQSSNGNQRRNGGNGDNRRDSDNGSGSSPHRRGSFSRNRQSGGRSGRGRDRRSPNGGRGRQKSTGTNTGGRQDELRPTDPRSSCALHPQGVHTWGECSLNPQSANYGRIPGRGGGRGHSNAGGRGRGPTDHYYAASGPMPHSAPQQHYQPTGLGQATPSHGSDGYHVHFSSPLVTTPTTTTAPSISYPARN